MDGTSVIGRGDAANETSIVETRSNDGYLESTDTPINSQMSSLNGSQSASQTGSQVGSQRRSRKPKLPKRDRNITEVCDLNGPGDIDTYNKSYFNYLYEKSHTDLAIIDHVLAKSRKIIVITGAGISVAAGIPDFRSKLGLFRTLKDQHNLKGSGKDMFEINVYQDQTSISNFHKVVKDLNKLCVESSPTPFHYLLQKISQDNRLLRLYTQNIDCLDSQLSSLETKIPLSRPWPRTIQLHGTIRNMTCSKCRFNGPLKPELFDSNGIIPECPQCQELDSVREIVGKRTQGIGKLRPAIVLYNEANPESEAIGSITEEDLKNKPDALLVVGTSMKIPGVRRMVKEFAQSVHASKGAVIWMNKDDPPQSLFSQFENCFDLFVKGDCQVLPRLLDDYREAEEKKLHQKAILKEERKRKAELKAQEKLRKELNQSRLDFASWKGTVEAPKKKIKMDQEVWEEGNMGEKMSMNELMNMGGNSGMNESMDMRINSAIEDINGMGGKTDMKTSMSMFEIMNMNNGQYMDGSMGRNGSVSMDNASMSDLSTNGTSINGMSTNGMSTNERNTEGGISVNGMGVNGTTTLDDNTNMKTSTEINGTITNNQDTNHADMNSKDMIIPQFIINQME